MPIQTVTSAMATDRVIASIGRAVSDLAAAAGPIIRLNISRAPTTGTVMLVARAITSRNASSIRRADTPRASATSGMRRGQHQRPEHDDDRGDRTPRRARRWAAPRPG